MNQKNINKFNHPEIIIGLVAPIGCKLTPFIESLKKEFKKFGYDTKYIKITDLLENEFLKNSKESSQANNYENIKKIKSLYTFFKMEACTNYRRKQGSGYFSALVAKEIAEHRRIHPRERIVYIIDQLKNCGEFDLLNKVYSENYIQISCFSNFTNRDSRLKDKFKDDKHDNLEHINKTALKFIQKINSDAKFEYEDIRADTSHKLIEKDFLESVKDNQDNNLGQEVSELFKKSHFFVNFDRQNPNIISQTEKIVELLFGVYKEYPNQYEFGMAVATAISKRSNFPGTRHVGASIFSQHGEIISCGSIKAPVDHSNPCRENEDSIQEGYQNYYNQRKRYKEQIEKSSDISDKTELIKFINDSIEHHPCTHAEISAITDAAKMGISTRGSTLISTTFPCHMCAKDIISSGISKVIFLEAFPKSKNAELYSNIIEIDPDHHSDDKIPFITFFGVGPRKYNYFFGTENKQPEETQNESKQDEFVPPLLKWRTSKFYEQIEEEILSFIDNKKSSENFIFSEYLKKSD